MKKIFLFTVYLDLDTSHIFVSVPDENVAGLFASNVGYKTLCADEKK
jgi:hypothetical protein